MTECVCRCAEIVDKRPSIMGFIVIVILMVFVVTIFARQR